MGRRAESLNISREKWLIWRGGAVWGSLGADMEGLPTRVKVKLELRRLRAARGQAENVHINTAPLSDTQ